MQLKVVDNRRQQAVLEHRSIRRFTVHRTRAKCIGQIKDQPVDSNTRAETEPEECVSTPISRLGVVYL